VAVPCGIHKPTRNRNYLDQLESQLESHNRQKEASDTVAKKVFFFFFLIKKKKVIKSTPLTTQHKQSQKRKRKKEKEKINLYFYSFELNYHLIPLNNHFLN